MKDNSAHGYSEGSEIKADVTIDHDDFKAVQGAEVIRLTDGTRFIREDVASKTMAKYVGSKDEEIKLLSEANQAVLNSSTFERFLDISEQNVQLKQALKNMLILLNEHCNIDQILELKDREKLAEARKLIELNKPEK